MLTRCPHCQTAFRVTSEQLKVRQGKVRCGACREVFDALETLADETAALPPAVQEIPATPEVQEAVAAPQESPAPEPAAPQEAAQEALPVEPAPAAEEECESPPVAETAEAAAEESRPPQDGASAEEAAATLSPDQAEAPAPEAEDAAEAAAAPQAEEIAEAIEVAEPRRWPWLLGIAALLLLALGQALFFFRVELAVLAPELRPALAGACETFGCALPRPRKPELIGIESSDLAPAGADQTGRLRLTAAIKNRAPFDQEYPHLELTLTDTRDEPLLRKVLAPADWLPADRPAAAGFAAQGEAAVSLTFEAAGIPAIGYRLYLFYP
jgi:predicted Zn finger-like uncharacterized protein